MNRSTSSRGPSDLRRPPVPTSSLATVTRLAPAGSPCGAPVAAQAVQGTLALDLRTCAGMPSTPELRVVAPVAGTEDVHAWAARFAQAVVEVVGGDRPLSQLVRWTSVRVHNDLAHRVRVLTHAAPATQRLRTVRPQVRSVHVFQPGPASAEVSVHVRHGHRSRALAARLELRDDRWLCTALQMG